MRSSIRIVRLDGEKMKKRIKDSPKQCWNVLKEFIPKLQFEKIDYLCEIFKVEHDKVSRKPQSVDQFIVIMNDLKELSERFDNLTFLFQEIE